MTGTTKQDDGPCTDCGDTGVTYQTERPCSCAAGADTTKQDDVVQAPYLAEQFDWAAPGDQQEDAWLVRFCDKDCGEAIFTGPEAEREAWEYWNRYAPSFNIYVFRLARLKRTASTAPMREALEEGERALVEAKRELWAGARHSWNLADFKNWAVVQQIDAALASARAALASEEPQS